MSGINKAELGYKVAMTEFDQEIQSIVNLYLVKTDRPKELAAHLGMAFLRMAESCGASTQNLIYLLEESEKEDKKPTAPVLTLITCEGESC